MTKKNNNRRMLVTMDPNSGSLGPQAPSIMDSPTLARVERARIRLEAQTLNNNENHSLERRILDQKVSQTDEYESISFLYCHVTTLFSLIRSLTH